MPFVKPHLDLKQCQSRIKLCNRNVPVEKITKHTYVCSDHFSLNEVFDWKINLCLVPLPFHWLKKSGKKGNSSVDSTQTVPLFVEGYPLSIEDRLI